MRTRKSRIIKACVVAPIALIALLWMYYYRQIFAAFCQEGKPFEKEDGNILLSNTKSVITFPINQPFSKGNLPKQEDQQGLVSNKKSGNLPKQEDGQRSVSNKISGNLPKQEDGQRSVSNKISGNLPKQEDEQGSVLNIKSEVKKI
ncbi:uncharacterized protein LOC117337877 isoform X2 [Pecten maximus]|uniref:uncharacterized protein LOC117337877 isoform X2 n=1 Tax=Pecten maximus TaxID=6579 RepID=UPI001458761B|nr:uncharacterized protein LOC117337877 isoform X2 [Pecten maximus]